jgi:hypothetical protein
MLEALFFSNSGPTVFVPPVVLDNSIFQGFVKSSDLIGGNALAGLIGLSAGTSFNDDAGWLHFSDNGVEKYIARLPIRYGVTHAQYVAAGMKAGKEVVFNGRRFNVRLMTGLTNSSWPSISGQPTAGSEWNTYMYPIYDAPDRPSAPVWSTYKNADLGMSSLPIAAKGSITVTREEHSSVNTYFAARGYDYSGSMSANVMTRVTVINDTNANEGNGGGGFNSYGFRPILTELAPFPVYSDTGPGPTDLVKYDTATSSGYFGTVDNASFFTTDQIEAKALVSMTGTTYGRGLTGLWQKFVVQDKILFMPKVIQRQNTSWDDLYKAGFIFGTDDNGIDPGVNAPVNQRRTIDWVDGNGKIFTFAIRVAKGLTVNPSNNSGSTSPDVVGSEYSLTMERIYPTNGIDVAWASLGTPGPSPLVRESWNYLEGGKYTYSYVANGNSNAYTRSRTLKSAMTSGWLPVLELISVTVP